MTIERASFRTASLATHKIDTLGLPARQAREIWHHIVDGTYELEGAAVPDSGHRVRTQVWFLEELMLAFFAAEANVVNRSRVLTEQNPTPVVKVRLYRSGHSVLMSGNNQTTIGTGAVHFIDHDRPARQVSSNHEQVTLSVPYHLLGYDPALHPGILSVGLETPQGRLLKAGLESVFAEIGQVSPANAQAMTSSVLGLLRGSLEGSLDSQDDQSIRNARIAVMKRYIDQNLGDPELGIEALLQNFGASRATVYRDFKDEGGLQHYILSRRLHRSYRLLAETAPLRGSVQEVALRCGFLSLAHFSRAFRSKFDVAPSQMVGQWHEPRGSSTVLSTGEGEVGFQDSAAIIKALRWGYTRFK